MLIGHFVGKHLTCALHQRVGKLAPHQALDRKDGVVWIGNGLAPGDLAHQPFTCFGVDGHNGRHQACAFTARNDNRLAAFHHSYHRIRCPQVNADNFSHVLNSPCLFLALLRHTHQRWPQNPLT